METIRQELVQMQTSARVRPLDEIDGLSYTSLLSSLKNLNMPESSATEESNPDIDAIWEELRKEEDGVAATTEDGDEDDDNSDSSSSDSDSDEEESKGGKKQDEDDDEDEDLKLTADQVQDILKQIEPEAKNRLQALEQGLFFCLKQHAFAKSFNSCFRFAMIRILPKGWRHGPENPSHTARNRSRQVGKSRP